MENCFQYVKDTKKKANHNSVSLSDVAKVTVSNTSKILKRKQITTQHPTTNRSHHCFQYVKDTKKKANHNRWSTNSVDPFTVSNTSKILKRKQITTYLGKFLNVGLLFPIRQRY